MCWFGARISHIFLLRVISQLRAEVTCRNRFEISSLKLTWLCWTWICLAFALFVIQYVNLYQQPGSSILRRCGILIYSAWEGLRCWFGDTVVNGKMSLFENLSWDLTGIFVRMPASVAHLDASPTGDQEVAGLTPPQVGNILSWRLIMKYFLRYEILSLPLI